MLVSAIRLYKRDRDILAYASASLMVIQSLLLAIVCDVGKILLSYVNLLACEAISRFANGFHRRVVASIAAIVALSTEKCWDTQKKSVMDMSRIPPTYELPG
jgi:hypothetical protein